MRTDIRVQTDIPDLNVFNVQRSTLDALCVMQRFGKTLYRGHHGGTDKKFMPHIRVFDILVHYPHLG